MQPLDEHDQALLAELLAGERRADDAEVVARLRMSPGLRAEWEALRPVVTDFAQRTAAQRREIERAQGEVSPADVAQARRAVTAWQQGRQPRASRRLVLWLCAAAALLALAWGAWEIAVPKARNDRLGSPTGALDAHYREGLLHQLDWSKAGARGNAFFEVAFSAGVGPPATPFLTIPDIDDTWCTLTPAQQAQITREAGASVHCTVTRKGDEPDQVVVSTPLRVRSP